MGQTAGCLPTGEAYSLAGIILRAASQHPLVSHQQLAVSLPGLAVTCEK